MNRPLLQSYKNKDDYDKSLQLYALWAEQEIDLLNKKYDTYVKKINASMRPG